MSNDRWQVVWRMAVGTAALGWELQVDSLKHWPLLIPVFWLLGAPLELLIRFFTSGRLQINVRREEEKDDDQDQGS